MDNNKISDLMHTIWKFARGDMPASDFEKWVYAQPKLEDLLGKNLYFDVISADFSSPDVVFLIKKKLKEFAISYAPSSCMCSQLSNIAVIDMGDEGEKVFATFNQLRKRGNPYWWLAVYQCTKCKQAWLMGQESRQNDVFCFYRLDIAMLQDILNKDRWPTVFDRYEDLLRIGLEAGKHVRFLDPLNAKSLLWTMADVAKERPNIGLSELAELFNLDMELAREIAVKVVAEEHVQIDFNDTQ